MTYLCPKCRAPLNSVSYLTTNFNCASYLLNETSKLMQSPDCELREQALKEQNSKAEAPMSELQQDRNHWQRKAMATQIDLDIANRSLEESKLYNQFLIRLVKNLQMRMNQIRDDTKNVLQEAMDKL